jgi:hypothetical protein
MDVAEMLEMDCNPHESVHAIGATDVVNLVNLPVRTYCAKLQTVGGENEIGVFTSYTVLYLKSNVLPGELKSWIPPGNMEVSGN